ncbi:MAG: pantetheine-phosphate adenylyltransferase [Oscillospiraceae bacterium]|jgi:pantetheine-phosphate adenylyltransferase|nr:pantetheine-phosphate adenylyltransferase [Oscillospiraceae bacterium]
MSLALYPGSFDPVTNGHLDIIVRAAAIFEHLLVAVMQNPRKSALFSAEERVALLRRVTRDIPNVEIDTSPILLAEYAAGRGARVLVKGLRAVSDFELEFQMALLNRKLNPQLDTVFLTTGETHQYLSSSIVKEIGSLGGDISYFVPPEICDDVTRKLKK